MDYNNDNQNTQATGDEKREDSGMEKETPNETVQGTTDGHQAGSDGASDPAGGQESHSVGGYTAGSESRAAVSGYAAGSESGAEASGYAEGNATSAEASRYTAGSESGAAPGGYVTGSATGTSPGKYTVGGDTETGGIGYISDHPTDFGASGYVAGGRPSAWADNNTADNQTGFGTESDASGGWSETGAGGYSGERRQGSTDGNYRDGSQQRPESAGFQADRMTGGGPGGGFTPYGQSVQGAGGYIPAGSGRPADPSSPIRSGVPGGPSDPVRSGNASSSIRSGAPGGPSEPVRSGAPGSPSIPVHSGIPGGPLRPVHSGISGGPSGPAGFGGPGVPIHSGVSGGPGAPSRPGAPGGPGAPPRSGPPGGPGGPVHPGGPGGPSGPGFTPGPSAKGRSTRPAAVVNLKRSTVVVIALIMVVVCAAAAVGGGFLALNMVPTRSGSSGGSINLSVNPNENVSTTTAVAKKVGDSVVGITATYTVQNQNPFFGGGGSSESGGVGTGMIIDKNGYILTNSHVVLDGQAEKIAVLLSDGTTVTGTLKWNDPSIDLAIIQIDSKGQSLSPVDLGDSDKIQIGSYVAAIGNPLGLEFNNSVTQGVVSGLNRSITASGGASGSTHMEGLIQVDAAINSGNSGGPLLNSEGQVIGVNTAKAGAEGMGFAIPINTAKPIIEKVLKTGNFERVYIGVSAANASDIAKQYPKLNLGVSEGAFITEVTIGSPADEAGLIMKDVITAVDGTKIKTSAELIKTLLNYTAGETAEITYIRNSKEARIKIKLRSQKEVYGNRNQGADNGSGGSGGNGGTQDPYGYTDPYGGSDGSEEGGRTNPFDWLIPGLGE